MLQCNAVSHPSPTVYSAHCLQLPANALERSFMSSVTRWRRTLPFDIIWDLQSILYHTNAAYEGKKRQWLLTKDKWASVQKENANSFSGSVRWFISTTSQGQKEFLHLWSNHYMILRIPLNGLSCFPLAGNWCLSVFNNLQSHRCHSAVTSIFQRIFNM